MLTPPRHTSEGMKPGHMPHPSTVGSGNRAAWVCRQRPWLAAHIVVTVVFRSFSFVMKRETPALFNIFQKRKEEKERNVERKRERKREERERKVEK